MFKKLHLVVLLSLCNLVSYSASSVYSDYNYYVDYKKIVHELCGETIAPAKISDEERACVSATGASPVYGEILYESVAFLIEELKMTQGDVFYDLGSGLGKFTFWVYLMTPASCKGVEFSFNRNLKAEQNLKTFKKLYPQCIKCENSIRKTIGKPSLKKAKKTIEFMNSDMLKVDLSDATVVYTCSTCFDAPFMQKLTDKIAAECKDGTRVISLNQLAPHEHIHQVQVYKLPMTWSADTAVYSYVVDRTKVAEKNSEENKSDVEHEEVA